MENNNSNSNSNNNNNNEYQASLDQRLEEQLHPPQNTVRVEMEQDGNEKNKKEKKKPCISQEDTRVLSVGEWMIVILFYLIPVLNIIMMAFWSFSSRGNVHRRNLSRAGLLWLIILLIAYVLAMTIAGYTIMDIIRENSL